MKKRGSSKKGLTCSSATAVLSYPYLFIYATVLSYPYLLFLFIYATVSLSLSYPYYRLVLVFDSNVMSDAGVLLKRVVTLKSLSDFVLFSICWNEGNGWNTNQQSMTIIIRTFKHIYI